MIRTAILGLIAATAAVPAISQTAMVSITVKPSDFSSPGARAELDRRVAAAIEDICRTYTALEFYQGTDVADCRRAARAQLDSRLAQIQTSASAEAKSH